jgi:hypothetical protein
MVIMLAHLLLCLQPQVLVPSACRLLSHSEEKDLRISKLPAGVSSVMVERGPNPTNDNSAVWVNYQVSQPGPMVHCGLQGCGVTLLSHQTLPQ